MKYLVYYLSCHTCPPFIFFYPIHFVSTHFRCHLPLSDLQIVNGLVSGAILCPSRRSGVCVQLPTGVVNELMMWQEGWAAGVTKTGTGQSSWVPWIKQQQERRQNCGCQQVIYTSETSSCISCHFPQSPAGYFLQDLSEPFIKHSL